MSDGTKKAAVIGDLTGFGRCALTVSLPALASMGVQGCPLPTAIFSAHPWHEGYFELDMAPWLDKYISHWVKMDLTFDAVLIGFMRSYEQFGIIEGYIKRLTGSKARPFVILDPVMGDYGRRYKVVTADMLVGMRRLAGVADVITPNLTEACMLADMAYTDGILDEDRLNTLLGRLNAMTNASVIIKSVRLPEGFRNILYKEGKTDAWPYEPVPEDYPGCGDFFVSAFLGKLMQNGNRLEEAFVSACEKTEAAVKLTWQKQAPPGGGLLFEGIL